MAYGKTGAMRQTFNESSPRSLLQFLLKEHPTAGDEEIECRFLAGVQDDNSYLPAIVAYWVTNNLQSIRRQEQPSAPVSIMQRKTIAPRLNRIEVAKEVDNIVSVVILNLVMPNGKQLRKCTKADLVKFGGFYKRLAAIIPHGRTVEEANIGEAQVQALFNRK